MPSVNKPTRKLVLRSVEQHDLADLTAIETLGALEPSSLAMMRRWYERSRCVKHKRNRRLWLVMSVATDINGDALGHVVLLGEDGTADLARLVVHPHWRRQRIGSRLLEYAIDDARDRHSLATLHWIVHERDVAGVNFAKSFGMRTPAHQPIRKDWFGEGDDGYAFALTVEAPRDAQD